jgi:transposase
MKKRITLIGLDTHRNSIEVVLSDDSRNAEVRLYGSMGEALGSLDKMTHKREATGVELRFVYEAGPYRVVSTIARELSGFMWTIGKHVPVPRT